MSGVNVHREDAVEPNKATLTLNEYAIGRRIANP